MQSKQDLLTENTPLCLDTIEIDNSETKLVDETRLEITNNLIQLNINEVSVIRIMDAVDRMPGKDHIKGALRFLSQLKEERSQREEYYQWSNYAAEFFCTISNMGLFAVGAYSVRFSILIAATFSALSHAFPLQRFQQLDYLGVFAIFIEAATEYNAIGKVPIALAWGAPAFGIAAIDNLPSLSDRFFPGCKKKCDQDNPIFKEVMAPFIHSTWHVVAAFSLLMFYQSLMEVTHRDPSKTEQTIAEVWGGIGVTLCLLALAEGSVRKTYSCCKNTFFSKNNQANNSNYDSSIEESSHDLSHIVVKK